MTRLYGTIQRLLHARGYGFILGDDGRTWYLHAVNLHDQDAFIRLRTNMRVSFLVPQSGDQAQNVMVER